MSTLYCIWMRLTAAFHCDPAGLGSMRRIASGLMPLLPLLALLHLSTLFLLPCTQATPSLSHASSHRGTAGSVRDVTPGGGSSGAHTTRRRRSGRSCQRIRSSSPWCPPGGARVQPSRLEGQRGGRGRTARCGDRGTALRRVERGCPARMLSRMHAQSKEAPYSALPSASVAPHSFPRTALAPCLPLQHWCQL